MSTDTYSAFIRQQLICTGELPVVLSAVKDFLGAQAAAASSSGAEPLRASAHAASTGAAPLREAAGASSHASETSRVDAGAHAEGLLFFSHTNGRQVDFDLSGTLEQVLARVVRDDAAREPKPQGAKAGRGRPSLGVVAGEVTLLPRHWDWLAAQPAKASGTLRRLVDEERLRERTDPKKRAAALGTLLWSLAGDLPGFEEASRCLYRLDLDGLFALSDAWPGDLGPFVRGWFDGLVVAQPGPSL